jgi:hypothetical protein
MLSGVTIPAGSNEKLMFGAANHDPEIFEGPEKFDIRRSNAARQLTFGKGVHMRMSAPLGGSNSKPCSKSSQGACRTSSLLVSRTGTIRARQPITALSMFSALGSHLPIRSRKTGHNHLEL